MFLIKKNIYCDSLSLSEGYLKHPQGFTQPFSRLKSLLLILYKIIESRDDFLIITEVIKTYASLMS